MNEVDQAGRDEPAGGALPAVLWACFLGSSWTWVIGMLWPALLLRDYGVGGWLVFALPNVVGAAAMGFVLSSPAVSRRVAEDHEEAALRFSEVTIAFHVFAVGWVYWRLFGPWGVLATAGAALVLFMFVAGLAGRDAAAEPGTASAARPGRGNAGALGVATVVTIVSLVIAGLVTVWMLREQMTGWPRDPAMGGLDLLMLVPAAIGGFLLCPYLDLTFHRARQATAPTTGRWAFALGFGGVFLVMIVFSAVYAWVVAQAFKDPGAVAGPIGAVLLPGAMLVLLAIHLTLQAGFTVAVHLREVVERRGHVGLHRLASAVIIGGALAWWALSEPATAYHGRTVGEVVYRGFLLAYGLAFPAYVWLCMIPARRPVPMAGRLGLYAITLVITLPMGYLGFVAGQSGWIVAAVGVMGLAWLFVGRRAGSPSALD